MENSIVKVEWDLRKDSRRKYSLFKSSMLAWKLCLKLTSAPKHLRYISIFELLLHLYMQEYLLPTYLEQPLHLFIFFCRCLPSLQSYLKMKVYVKKKY